MERHYTSELSKGQGAISETMTLLGYWRHGMTATELATEAIESGALGRATAVRTKDLIRRVFVRRYFSDDGRPALVLKRLLERGADAALLRQLMLIFTARQHDILRDFISDVYWSKYEAGATHIARSDGEEFIRKAVDAGTISPAWSDTMVVKVARYLTGTLADFGLLEEGRATSKRILPYSILPATTVYLAHEIHFDGYSDNSVLEHPDWRLFGLTREDVVNQLERASRDGHFIIQYAGDLLRIAWQYETMEDCIDAIAG